jgi:putative addiction module component (TIGR02574 family)
MRKKYSEVKAKTDFLATFGQPKTLILSFTFRQNVWASKLASRGKNTIIMSMSTVPEIEAALAKMLPEEQCQVAAWLDAQLAPAGFDAEVEDEWADVIKRRMEDLDSGRVQGVPAEQVFARARRILGR